MIKQRKTDVSSSSKPKTLMKKKPHTLYKCILKLAGKRIITLLYVHPENKIGRRYAYHRVFH